MLRLRCPARRSANLLRRLRRLRARCAASADAAAAKAIAGRASRVPGLRISVAEIRAASVARAAEETFHDLPQRVGAGIFDAQRWAINISAAHFAALDDSLPRQTVHDGHDGGVSARAARRRAGRGFRAPCLRRWARGCSCNPARAGRDREASGVAGQRPIGGFRFAVDPGVVHPFEPSPFAAATAAAILARRLLRRSPRRLGQILRGAQQVPAQRGISLGPIAAACIGRPW